LRKGRKREQGETAKENKDRPDRNVPKNVLVDQREAKFVEAEDDGQERAENGDEQVGEGINEFLIMKQKKDTPMQPPGAPRPELEDPAGGNLDINQPRPSVSMPTLPTFHSVSNAALVAKYRAERVKDPREFDKKTAEINKAPTTAKIRREDNNSLTQGDYTVELASREDAAKIEKWRDVQKSLDRIHKNEDLSREKGKDKTKKRFEAQVKTSRNGSP